MKIPDVVLLTREEEESLGRRVRAWLDGGDDALAADGLAARNELAERMLPLVRWTLANFCRTDLPHDPDDDEAVGMLALLRAAEKYDPGLGFRFYTYAVHAIGRSVYRWRMEQCRGPIRVPNRGGPPPRWLADPDWALECAPADAEVDAADDVPASATVATLMDAAGLDARERDVLARVFGLGGMPRATLEACGDIYGVSKERTRQIRNKAIARIRARCRGLDI